MITPRTVTVTANNTENVGFEVVCDATTGSIEVSVSTTGDDLDDGYEVTLDGAGSGRQISDGNPVTFDNVTPGGHNVTLSGNASNCSVQSDNPRSVDVAAGDQKNVQFDVICSAAAANTSPTAENDSYITSVGTQLRAPGQDVASLLANDSDIDGDNLSTVPEAKSTREQGNVVIGADGSFDYTPAGGFTGPDSFEYTVIDGRGGESTGVATIQVNPAE